MLFENGEDQKQKGIGSKFSHSWMWYDITKKIIRGKLATAKNWIIFKKIKKNYNTKIYVIQKKN